MPFCGWVPLLALLRLHKRKEEKKEKEGKGRAKRGRGKKMEAMREAAGSPTRPPTPGGLCPLAGRG